MAWIQNARSVALRLWSVKLAIASGAYSAAAGAWVLLPTDWKPDLTEPVKWVMVSIGVLLAVSPGVARLVHQPAVTGPACTDKASN